MRRAFDLVVVNGVDRWSKRVTNSVTDRSAERSAEEVALACFFTKKNIERHAPAMPLRPVGHVLHYAAKNVDTTFAYVLIVSLLCGNANTVRLTSDAAVRRRQEKLIAEISECVPEAPQIADQSATNAELAKDCDLRVIWGGDAAVSEIRADPVKPGAREVLFCDRRSIAVVCAEQFIAQDQKLLTSDITWMDQASCTSVRGIVWVGEEYYVDGAVLKLSNPSTRLPGAIERFSALQRHLLSGGRAVPSADRTKLVGLMCKDGAEFERAVQENTAPGVVCHTRIDSIKDWTLPKFNGRDPQTIVVSPFEAYAGEVIERVPSSRVVRPGQSMKFDESWTWDGYDLVAELARGAA